MIILIQGLECQIFLEDSYVFKEEMLNVFSWCYLGGREKIVNQLIETFIFAILVL